MIPLASACLVVATLLGATFLPYFSGGYDFLAAPISAIAWTLGRVGLLLVPLGGFWLWAAATNHAGAGPPRWLAWVTVAVCVVISLAAILVAFAGTSSLLLAGGTAAIAGILNLLVLRNVRATDLGSPRTKLVAATLMIAPLVVWGAQSALVEPLTTQARNRVIALAAPLIAEIERYHARHGRYPASLFAIWGDYKPGVLGVERYFYEPSGDAFNVIFREPALGFGLRRFVVYNPRDKQRVTVHEQDRLLLDEAGLDADNAGYTVIEPLPQPHWKLFVFLS